MSYIDGLHKGMAARFHTALAALIERAAYAPRAVPFGVCCVDLADPHGRRFAIALHERSPIGLDPATLTGEGQPARQWGRSAPLASLVAAASAVLGADMGAAAQAMHAAGAVPVVAASIRPNAARPPLPALSIFPERPRPTRRTAARFSKTSRAAPPAPRRPSGFRPGQRPSPSSADGPSPCNLPVNASEISLRRGRLHRRATGDLERDDQAAALLKKAASLKAHK
jgi:hypothetical protein